MNKERAILLQFANSHFCEKSRWLLDLKKIEYFKNNLLPGLHFKTVKKFSDESHLPILLLGDAVIQGTDKIAAYYGTSLPTEGFDFFENNPRQYQLMLEFERQIDTEIGQVVRQIIYNEIVGDSKIMLRFFVPERGFWRSTFMKITQKPREKMMRKRMNLSELNSQEAQIKLQQTLNVFEKILDFQPYLLGDEFSRADLTLAALLSPLRPPAQYGEKCPQMDTPLLEELRSKHEKMLDWVERIYDQHR